jgi:hypothetical protein
MTDNANRQPPAHLLAAAERDYHAMQDVVAVAVQGARLLAAGSSEVEAFTEVYYALSRTDPGVAAAMGATAIVQLATRNATSITRSSRRRQS